MERRFIEVIFPLKELSKLCQREKSASSKTLTLLHTWWARKPQTLSRAIIAGSILSVPSNESERKRIEELLKKACTLDVGEGRKSSSFPLSQLILEINHEIKNKERPVIFDPFAGGGAIPFEARRLCLDVFSNDLNPVSYLVRKVGLELIPELGIENNADFSSPRVSQRQLLSDFDKWSKWLYEKVKGEVGRYFEEDTLNYLWVKTCHCRSCGREIPLLNMKISKKKGKVVNPQISVDKEKGTFKIKLSSAAPSILKTRKGVLCPFCDALTTTLNDVKKEGKTKGLSYFPVCKYVKTGKRMREFNPLTEEDIAREKKAKERLEELKSQDCWNFFIPSEWAPGLEVSSVTLYGLDTFDKFYSPRQLLTIIHLMKYVSLSFDEMLNKGVNEKRARLIVLLLSFVINKFATKNCLLTTWDSISLSSRSLFAGPQLRMTKDYVESSPISLTGSGSFWSSQKSVRKAVETCMIPVDGMYHDSMGCVTDLEYSDCMVDVIVTDPPHRDYIVYSSLSDFFYVLLKRMLNVPFADIFKTPLTPKFQELVIAKKTPKSLDKVENAFLKGWKECYRVLKKNGLLVIMSLYRGLGDENWILSSLYHSNFYAVATWPILSERVTRYNQGKANVNFTLLIVCRKRERGIQKIGDYREVRKRLKKLVYKRSMTFFEQDLSKADYFICILGPAMEFFSKYRHVEKSSGEQISLSHFFRLAQHYVGDFMLEQLFNFRMPVAVDKITRFYILWRCLYGISAIPTVDYRSLCKVTFTNSDELMKLRISKKDVERKSLVSVNQYFERNFQEYSFSLTKRKYEGNDQTVITRLHLALYLLSTNNLISFREFIELEGIKDGDHVIVQIARILETIFSSLVDIINVEISEHSLLQKFLLIFNTDVSIDYKKQQRI